MIPRPVDTTLDALEASLDAATTEERVQWLHSLGKADMKHLYDLAEGRAVDPDFFLDDKGEAQVFFGKNSLPLFNRFQKHFKRHGDRVQGWNVNKGVARWFGGPGHFLVRRCEQWDDQLIFDYFWEPDSVPEDFPPPASNLAGTYRLVYGKMEDVVRRVSRDVIISKGFRAKKPEGVWFTLCRP